MQRSSMLLLIICCVLALTVSLAYADFIKLKGENSELGGIRGRIISGAKPGKKAGEVERTEGVDEVEVAIIVNKKFVGTVKVPWDKIESIEFTSQNAASYEVDEELRKKQGHKLDQQTAAWRRWQEEQKAAAAAKAKEESEGEEATTTTKKEEEDSFMPDEEKQVDTWISQLGLGAKAQQGRRRYAKAKLIEKGKKVVKKVAGSLNTTNITLKTNAAAVLRGIGKNAEEAIPSLLKAASDDNKFVRWEVIEALRAVTGKNFGYGWKGALTEQRKVIGKWQEWWKKKQDEKTKNEAEEEKKVEEKKKKADEIEKAEDDGYKLEPTNTKPIGK